MIDDFKLPGKKFRTCHRDAYHEIRDNDETGLFASIIGIFLTSFSIGYHLNRRVPLGPSAINHTNMPYINEDTQELIILLMIDRHHEIQSADELWKMVEEYSEYGISVLLDSLKNNDWMLDVDAIATGATND